LLLSYTAPTTPTDPVIVDPVVVDPTDPTDDTSTPDDTDTSVDPTGEDETGLSTKDLITYICGGAGLLFVVVLILLQLFLKDGLPCCRCCKVENEFTVQNRTEEEPFVNRNSDSKNKNQV